MLSILMLISLPLLAHCGSSSSGGTIAPTKSPVFAGSGTAGAPNRVVLEGGPTSPGSLIQVNVKIGGPTTSTDLFSFSFNIKLSNPGIVRNVTWLAGDALTGEQAVVSTLNGDKLVIGVSKLGGTGNGVGAAGATLLSLMFKMDPTAPGTTNLKFDDPKVQDHTGAFLTTVEFDGAAATLTQPQ